MKVFNYSECVHRCRDVFSAGASHYGVADLELLAQETHKFESRYLDQLIGPYPAEKKVYEERSPIHALDKFTAPTAFFQVSLYVCCHHVCSVDCMMHVGHVLLILLYCPSVQHINFLKSSAVSRVYIIQLEVQRMAAC